MPDEQVAGLEIPTGIPLVYQFGPDLRPNALGGQYLDPHAAREAFGAIKGGSYELAH
jgi:2,3-bisphosphoglycerate-dependent phosphoglycerate mutase